MICYLLGVNLNCGAVCPLEANNNGAEGGLNFTGGVITAPPTLRIAYSTTSHVKNSLAQEFTVYNRFFMQRNACRKGPVLWE